MAVLIWLALILNSFIGMLVLFPDTGSGEQIAMETEWYVTQDGARGIALGDLDKSNGTDIVTVNSETDNVSVFLKDVWGDLIHSNYTTGDEPMAVAIADLDNDTFPDIVTSNKGNDTVSVLINDGIGGFDNHTEYGIGPDPRGIFLGDVDGTDGIDIVAVLGNNKVSVIRNNGSGEFGGLQAYSVGENPLSVALGDIDDDDHLDIVTANRNSSKVTVRINDGSGLFPAREDYPTCLGPTSLYLADMDGDLRLDIVATGNSLISVLLNNGSGFNKNDYMVGSRPSSVVVGDVDDDRDKDIITSNELDHSVTVLYNNGIGRFSKSIEYDVGTYPRDLALADIDGDSDFDIVMVNYCDRTNHPFGRPYVLVLTNNGMGSFGCKRRDYELDERPGDIIMSKMNSGTYAMDVVISNGFQVTSMDANYVGILGNRSDNWMISPVTALAVGEVDGQDGSDIITLHNTNPLLRYLTVSYNDGNGSFDDSDDYVLVGSSDDLAFLDDTERIVVVNKNENNMGLYTTIGGFVLGPTNHTTISDPEHVVAGNLDNDHNTDVIVYNRNRFSVLLTDITGAFEPKTDYGFGLDDIVLDDIDGDFDDDIIGVSKYDDKVIVYLNVGLGVFNSLTKSSFPVGNMPVGLAVGDLDGDNLKDIVTANENDNTVSILFNDGQGSFGQRTDYKVGEEPEKVALGDINFDGRLDIGVLNTETLSYSFSVLMNDGYGVFYEDSDEDGFNDDEDDFPIDPSEWLDSDTDGYGDFFDDLPWNRLEYVDQDGDFHGDTFSDAFPEEITQWSDRDGDGFGDNRPGTNVTIRGKLYSVEYGDLFPENPLEWMDSDSDGTGDNSDTDDDNDGYEDVIELNEGSDPYNKSDIPADLDSDGIPDSTDDDKDNDGYSNYQDAFPMDPNEYMDTDNDGTGDNADTDDDNDNWPDLGIDGQPGKAGVDDDGNLVTDDDWEQGWEGSDDDIFPLDRREWEDTDDDGIGNNADTDDDNDGYGDFTDVFPLDVTCWQDNDRDDVPDFYYSDLNDTFWNGDEDDDDDNWPDFGEDGKPGIAGFDDDGNFLVDDYWEQGWGGSDDDIFPLDRREWKDTDDDGIGNNADTDDDDDGFPDTVEESMNTDPENESDEPDDTDGDWIPDSVDMDDDNDGWSDMEEGAASTDTLDAASFPEDTDNDTVPDYRDTDDDNDGWTDVLEDSLGYDPLDPDSKPTDTDGDSIPDELDMDDDNDGHTDKVEALVGTSATDSDDFPEDTDGDGTIDYYDTDSDNDGYLDTVEEESGADPKNSSVRPDDNDGDFLPDGMDPDDDNDGYPDAVDDFPLDPIEWLDTDGDGMGDNEDDDDDGDNITDDIDIFPLNPREVLDTDGDGIGDQTDQDIDGDGVLNYLDAFPYNETEWKDSDGDGIGNVEDPDDDNDGTPDKDEEHLGYSHDGYGTNRSLLFSEDPQEWEDNDGDGIGDNADRDDDNDGIPDTNDQHPKNAKRGWIKLVSYKLPTKYIYNFLEILGLSSPILVIILLITQGREHYKYLKTKKGIKESADRKELDRFWDARGDIVVGSGIVSLRDAFTLRDLYDKRRKKLKKKEKKDKKKYSKRPDVEEEGMWGGEMEFPDETSVTDDEGYGGGEEIQDDDGKTIQSDRGDEQKGAVGEAEPEPEKGTEPGPDMEFPKHIPEEGEEIAGPDDDPELMLDLGDEMEVDEDHDLDDRTDQSDDDLADAVLKDLDLGMEEDESDWSEVDPPASSNPEEFEELPEPPA